MAQKTVMAIDLGGTRIMMGLVSGSEILFQRKWMHTPAMGYKSASPRLKKHEWLAGKGFVIGFGHSRTWHCHPGHH